MLAEWRIVTQLFGPHDGWMDDFVYRKAELFGEIAGVWIVKSFHAIHRLCFVWSKDSIRSVLLGHHHMAGDTTCQRNPGLHHSLNNLAAGRKWNRSCRGSKTRSPRLRVPDVSPPFLRRGPTSLGNRQKRETHGSIIFLHRQTTVDQRRISKLLLFTKPPPAVPALVHVSTLFGSLFADSQYLSARPTSVKLLFGTAVACSTSSLFLPSPLYLVACRISSSWRLDLLRSPSSRLRQLMPTRRTPPRPAAVRR